MNKDLRIVFMGTPEFAVASLAALYEASFNVVGVVTTTDKKAGRGKKIKMAAVKTYALEKGIPVLTPLKLKDPEFLDALRAWEADLQIVVAFRMLPEIVWKAPRLGTFNLHSSLLPQYRGAAPINHAIMNGEKESGVTTFFLDKEIDTGRIIAQKKCRISFTDNAEDLHDRLMSLGAKLVLETVDAISNGALKTQPQSDLPGIENLKKAPKIFKEDGVLNWHLNAETIYNKIRALSPYPAAWSILHDENVNAKYSVKIFSSKIVEGESNNPGRLITDNKTFLRVATKDHSIEIYELQLQGKKRMKIGDFLRGFSISHNMKFR